MKNRFLRLVLLLLVPMVLSSCDLEAEEEFHDGSTLSPSDLVGEWTLVSLYDKTGVLLGATMRSIAAGVETRYSVSTGGQDYIATFLITGGAVMTQDHYEIWLNTTISIPGLGTSNDSFMDAGSYTVNGSNVVMTSNSSSSSGQSPLILAWGFEGPELLLQDEDTRMRYAR